MDAVKTSTPEWQAKPEAGSDFAVRLLLATVAVLGRRFAEFVLWFVSAYFVATRADARRASASYLPRVGVRPHWWNSLRHIHTFACVALHRFFFVQNRTEGFELRKIGMEPLDALAEAKGGVVLLGAHFGSFEALRAGARTQSPARVNVVMDQRNARMIRKFLSAAAPDDGLAILEVGEGAADLLLRARACVERGEQVAVLADRVGDTPRHVRVPFLGGEASFPQGPFLLAASLRCPVFLTVGIYRGGGRYDLVAEKLAEQVLLPRGDRQAALEGYVRAYANRLETLLQSAPYNWFNFFDFWAPVKPQ